MPIAGRRFAERMLAIAREANVPDDQILAGLGLDMDGEGFDATIFERLDGEQVRRLGSRLVVLLARRASLAEGRDALRQGDWDVILYCLLSGRTLRQAIAHAVQAFDAIDGRCGRIALVENGAVAEVRIDAERSRPTLMGCAVDLNGLASIHGLLEWLLARALPLRSIHLAYGADLCRQLGHSEFPYPLLTDCRWTGFSFAGTWLDHPVVRHINELSGRPPQSFLFEIGTRSADASLPDRIRRSAIEMLRSRGKLPAFADIAEQHGFSVPTLRRQLARQGASYRHIKASCRREVGLELLRQPRLTIEDIAVRLDFCDADAFREAFRTWFGKSPTSYRREATGHVDAV